MSLEGWKEASLPMHEARWAWLASGSDADRARFDAETRRYKSRFDCSCPTEGPKVCVCTFDGARSDAAHDSINQAPFTFAMDDPRYAKAVQLLGPERCRQLRQECEDDILEHPAMRRGQELAGAYNKILRAAIVTVYPDLADRAAVESTDWLRQQFDVLPVPKARSDAHDYRSNFQTQESPMSFDQFLKEANGNYRLASQLELQAARNRERDASVRADADDDIVSKAEAERDARNLAAQLGSFGETTNTVRDVQHRTAVHASNVARMDARDADLRKARADRDRLRLDAIPTSAKCRECGEELDPDDVEAGIHPECATEVARADMKTRNAALSRAPFGFAAKMRGYNPDDAA